MEFKNVVEVPKREERVIPKEKQKEEEQPCPAPIMHKNVEEKIPS